MSKAEDAVNYFSGYNCAQSVLAAYAGDLKISKNEALQIAVGFGGGMGRAQEVCGAISGAIAVLGLASGFKEEDGREKINQVYAQVHSLIKDFTAKEGTILCRDLLKCDLLSEEGQKYFKENKLKEKCFAYVRLCCELLDGYLAEKK